VSERSDSNYILNIQVGEARSLVIDLESKDTIYIGKFYVCLVSGIVMFRSYMDFLKGGTNVGIQHDEFQLDVGGMVRSPLFTVILRNFNSVGL
jgi:hypothetical protein